MKEINPNLPIDKKSKIVVSKSIHHGCDYNPGSRMTSMVPFPTRQFLGPQKHNLSGRKTGRFTVIGISSQFRKPSRDGERWVVKCSCGRYEIRRMKSIKNATNTDACGECKNTAYLRRVQSKSLQTVKKK